MAPLPSLLRFCDFLENRVHTASFSLLRRILREFHTGHEHTLVEFMRLGASAIAVLPVERASRRRRKEASRLLAQEPVLANEDAPLDDTSQSNVCVFKFLLARVATHNILWLGDMYGEFCRGEEKLLQNFVNRGDECISITPVDIKALNLAPLPPPPLLLVEPGSKRAREVTGAEQRAGGSRKAQRRAIKAEMEEADDGEAEDLRKRILFVVDRIESTNPWLTVLNPANLPCPFSREEHPALAAALDSFWKNHGQAVWERMFWTPLSRKRAQETHYVRRTRQYKAQQAFETTVMLPAYRELGAHFFAELDQLPSPHKGWWYLSGVEDLYTMAKTRGLATCVKYIESQALERYPKSPGGGRRYFNMRNSESISMWSSADALQPALRAIRELKARAE